MPRSKDVVNDETFNVFEDTDSASSSSASSSSDDRGGVFGSHCRTSTGKRKGVQQGTSRDISRISTLQRYFTEKGALQFADSHVFVQGAVGERAHAEAEATVLPPLPPPPRDVITLAATPAPTTISTPMLTALETEDGAIGLSERPTRKERKMFRRMDAETAARVAGLRPIQAGSAGTTSVDLLNTFAMPTQTIPASTMEDQRRRRRKEKEAARKTAGPSQAVRLEEHGKGESRSGGAESLPVAPLSLQTTTTSSETRMSIGSGSLSGLDGNSPGKTSKAEVSQGNSAGAPEGVFSNKRGSATRREDTAVFAESATEQHSDTEEGEDDTDSSESDEAYWRQLETERYKELSPIEAGDAAAAAVVVPPLRAHVYIEEGNGKFMDHEQHALVQARRAAQSAAEQEREEQQQRRAMRRARRRGGGDSRLFADPQGRGGDSPGNSGPLRPRRSDALGSSVDPTGEDDPRKYRSVCLLLLQYIRRVNVFLGALACGAAVLMLIVATLPSVRMIFDVRIEQLADSGEQQHGGAVAAGNLALLVLLVRVFDGPFFIFISLTLIVCSLLPLVWGVADGHWRHHGRFRRTVGLRSVSASSGCGGRLGKVQLRNAVRSLTDEARQRCYGDTAVEASTWNGPRHAPESGATSPRQDKQAVLGNGYTLDPAVSAQLTPHAFVLGKERQKQRVLAEEKDALQGTVSRGGLSGTDSGRHPMATSMTLGASAFFPLYSSVAAGGVEADGTVFEDTMGMSYLNGTTSLQDALSRASNSDSGGRAWLGASLSCPTPRQQRQALGRSSAAGALNSPSHSFRHDPQALSAPQLPASPVEARIAGGARGKPMHSLSSEARRRFADSFLLDGGMLSASNSAAIHIKAAERWLAAALFGRGATPRMVALLQPRLWCLVVCLAMSVVELALLDARTAPQLFQLLSVATEQPLALGYSLSKDGSSSAERGAAEIGYNLEGRIVFNLSTAVATEEEALLEEPWTNKSVRDTFLAVYAVRATVLLIVWLLDVFF